MPPDSGCLCVGVNSRNHQFAPGLTPGWPDHARVLEGVAESQSSLQGSSFQMSSAPPTGARKTIEERPLVEKRPLFAARRWILYSWRTVLKLTCSKFSTHPLTLEREITRPQQIGEPPKTETKHATGLKTSTFDVCKVRSLESQDRLRQILRG